MTEPMSPDLLDLAEAVTAGRLRVDDAEQHVREALGSQHGASEKGLRDLRRLIVAADAVRSHADATREAIAASSPDVALANAHLATVVGGSVRAGAGRRQSSRGGGGRAPRRTWLLIAATLLVGGGVIAASIVGARLVAPNPVPTAPVAIISPSVGPEPTPNASPSTVKSATVVPARAPSWTATGSMAGQVRRGIAVPLENGRVLVMGGFSNPGPGPDAEIYDPGTGTWTATGPMVTPRWQSAAVRLLNGRVLVASGAGDPGVLASAELYDPSTNSWAATGSSATARYNATLTLLPDGRVLLAGGDIVTHVFNPSVASAELYDPATGSWSPTGSMQTARSANTAILLPGGKVLVVGGWSENDTLSYPLGSAELYDPATGTWAAAHEMDVSTSVQTATLLADGRILVVGGTYELPTPEFVTPQGGIAATAELYDPGTDSWTTTGDLGRTVWNDTATLLSDGRVLVAGGMDAPWIGNVPASASAAIYDPRTGTWRATRDMIEGRSEHTATLLSDGMVLVAGGIIGLGENDDGPGILGIRDSAELYDPGTGR